MLHPTSSTRNDYEQKINYDWPKETLRIVLIVIASNKWKCQAIDVKAAFLQSKPTEREVYVIPPQEANEKDNAIQKLKKCVYGLGDASRNWYLSIAEKLEELKIKCYKSDPALFVYPENNKLQGIICAHVDDYIYEGDKLFNEQIRNVKKNYYWNRE